MPTVLRVGGLRVTIYPNDHRPAHVHVFGNGTEAVFYLNCPAGPLELRESYGCSVRDVTTMKRELRDHLATLCPAWEQLHGLA